jgi:hypothetical protein
MAVGGGRTDRQTDMQRLQQRSLLALSLTHVRRRYCMRGNGHPYGDPTMRRKGMEGSWMWRRGVASMAAGRDGSSRTVDR